MRTRLTSHEVEQVITRYRAGVSARQIALEMGRTTAGILLVLRRNHVPQVRFARRHTTLDELAICEDYKTMPFSQLTKKYGVDQNVLTRVLRRHGVVLRPRGRQFSRRQPVYGFRGAAVRLTCEHCGTEKHISDFHFSRSRKSLHEYVCKDCVRWKDRKRNYDITREQYNQMHAQQGGKCGICGEQDPKELKDLAVDHNHTTGQIRELLCARCNHLIGHAREDTGVLIRAIGYLVRHQVPRIPLDRVVRKLSQGGMEPQHIAAALEIQVSQVLKVLRAHEAAILHSQQDSSHAQTP